MPLIAVVPLYDGAAIFGPCPHVRGRATEIARSTRGFSGVNGLVSKKLGTRGATAEASGCLFGPTPADLRTAEAVFELYLQLGDPHDLVDTVGRTWPLMILVTFEYTSEPYQDEGGWSRDYRATFLGLALPTAS
jgi:hypothetical protein